MKLIIAIVSNDDANKVQSELTKNGFSITKLATTGGFLMSGNTTLICGTQDEKVDKAISIIRNIVTELEPGMVMNGKVVRIMNFGAFVELAPGKDGMVHISKLSDKRVGKVEDVVNIGDEVTVKVIEIDKMGRVNLSMRPADLAPKSEK